MLRAVCGGCLTVIIILILYAVLKMANFQVKFVGPVNNWPD